MRAFFEHFLWKAPCFEQPGLRKALKKNNPSQEPLAALSLAAGQKAFASKWPVLCQELGAGSFVGRQLRKKRSMIQPISLCEQVAHVVLVGRAVDRADLTSDIRFGAEREHCAAQSLFRTNLQDACLVSLVLVEQHARGRSARTFSGLLVYNRMDLSHGQSSKKGG